MTIAEFFVKNGEIGGFRVSGHAGHGDHGNDVVCASVSSAVMLTANLITDYFGISADVSAEGDTITLKSRAPQRELHSLCKGLMEHLNCIAEDYGEKYLKIKLTEV